MSEEITEETTPTIESYEQLIESATPNEWLESKVGTQLFQESEIVPIKLIDAGWGSSGHYSKEVLERDGSNAFPAGTHMYVNHQSTSERATRPERDVRNLAAVTISAARWEEGGKDGAGLYAQAEVFSSHVPFIKERANHIGVSIVADGVVESGEAEGRKGRIIKSIKRGYSADFVTRAGRGGKVFFEDADIGDMPIRETIILGGDSVAEINEANAAELSRLLAENEAQKVEITQLKNALVMAEAKGIVINTLAEFSLPETVAGLVESQAVGSLPMTESGSLDAAKLVESVTALAEAIKVDIKPQQQRSVVGDSGFQAPPKRKTLEELKAESAKFLMREGVDEDAALFAVNGA